MQLKKKRKVANRDWVDHQACSLLPYINVLEDDKNNQAIEHITKTIGENLAVLIANLS